MRYSLVRYRKLCVNFMVNESCTYFEEQMVAKEENIPVRDKQMPHFMVELMTMVIPWMNKILGERYLYWHVNHLKLGAYAIYRYAK